MSWTVVAGKSPVQNPGVVVTIATITNDATGKSFDAEVRNDGTLAGLQAACAALVLKVDGQSKPVFVAPGTSFAIADPANPTPPTDDQLAQAAYFDGRRKVATIRQLLELKRDGIDQSMLDAAIAAWNALRVDLTWEGLGASK